MKKTLLGLALVPTLVFANPFKAELTEHAKNEVASWANNSVVVEAIKAQNNKHAGLTQNQIDEMDKTWRSQVGAGSSPMIDDLLSNELSAYLKKVQDDSAGMYTEIFVMDNKGLNVGQSAVTSDYWQGDEDKWQKSYLMGANSVFVDEVEEDESTQTFQSQVSYSITDPDSGEVVGAVTVGVNVEAL